MKNTFQSILRSLVGTLAFFLLGSGASFAATPPQHAALFGVRIAGGTVAQVKAAILRAGMTPTGHSSRFCSLYNVNGLLQGATTLKLCGDLEGQVAFISYLMPSKMDAGQVKRVIDMVARKYGPPLKTKGSVDVGPVTAIWRMPDGSGIMVARRNWPDTTTNIYLSAIK